uniref:Cytotoxic T-lymphocyte protein 4-like n=1 Tax=Salmo trutta TaxID=8032 RepID=A0A673WNK2_SALTR
DTSSATAESESDLSPFSFLIPLSLSLSAALYLSLSLSLSLCCSLPLSLSLPLCCSLPLSLCCSLPLSLSLCCSLPLSLPLSLLLSTSLSLSPSLLLSTSLSLLLSTSLSLSLLLSTSLSLSFCCSLPLSLSPSLSAALYLSLSLFLLLSTSLSLSLSLSFCCSLPLPLSLSFCCSLPLSLSPSLSAALYLSLSLSLSVSASLPPLSPALRVTQPYRVVGFHGEVELFCSYHHTGRHEPEELWVTLYRGMYREGKQKVCTSSFTRNQTSFQVEGEREVRCRGQLRPGRVNLTVSGLRGNDTDLYHCGIEVMYPPPYLRTFGNGTLLYIPEEPNCSLPEAQRTSDMGETSVKVALAGLVTASILMVISVIAFLLYQVRHYKTTSVLTWITP